LNEILKDKTHGRGVQIFDNNIFSETSDSLVRQTIMGAEVISPLVKALEDENKVLKEEVNNLIKATFF
jgi:hypothetical protein